MSIKSYSKKSVYIKDIIILVILLITDQVSKYYAVSRLKGHPAYSIIRGILEFHYIENSGAAFGLLKDELAFFCFCDILMFSAIIYTIVRSPAKKRFIPMNICFVFIVSGALGNLIDRFIYGSVVDFIYFSFKNLPIFNIADLYITVSTILLIAFMIFYYKEDDLNFLRFKEKKLREID